MKNGSTSAVPTPPIAKKKPKETKIHGYTMVDDYFWLREKENPEVIKYLEEENAYTEYQMRDTKDFQDALYKEMLGRIKQTDFSVPYRYGDYYYYTRTEEGKQYPVYCRSKNQDKSGEEVTLDLNELAKGYKYLGLAAYSISDDGNLLAYSLDYSGYRQYKLFIKDLRTGKNLPESFERVGSVMWANDNKTLFYSTEDAVSKRSDKIWRHVLGNKDSEMIYEEKDEIFDVFGGRSLDKKMIFVTSVSKTSAEVRYIPADQPTVNLKVILPREKEHEYSVDHYDGMFYIMTNKNAKNFRVVSAPVNDASEKNWKDFIPHNPKVKVDGITFFVNHAVVSEKENGLDYLRVLDLKTKRAPYRIETPENDYAIGLAFNPEYNTKTIRFNYTSLITPSTLFEFDMTTMKRTTLKQQEVLGGYDASQYVADRVWAVARDGVKVPISIVYKKGVKLDGNAPMLLYAYGSYGASIPPSFNSSRLSLLNRGAIFALAHIRGGGELGEEWRQQGRMSKKMNTFNDFIDSADWLIKNKYTKNDRLVIQGGSAGGLLMGAVVNLRPDLFKASLAQVPFVDVMNTMLDASLPLTTSEYIEWGNPNIKEEFDYMMTYSPYDNVKAQNYPVMMIQVSLNDSQVPYWEGAKWAAKLRAMKTDNNPLMLKTNMGAGHGGSSGRYDALKEAAFSYAFILSQMGINK